MCSDDTTQPTFITLGSHAKNLTKIRFGRLVALGPIGKTVGGQIMWLCLCDCGNKTNVRSSHLLQGTIVSCGCFGLERSIATHKKHGMSRAPIYAQWSSIVQRCTNPNCKEYRYYGGREDHPIQICDEWRNSFESFRDYMSQLPNYGEDGYSIDRVDNNDDYKPGNVRFATKEQQSQNTRQNHMLTFNGKTQGVSAWGRETGLGHQTISKRLLRGWSVELALTTPRRKD